MHAGKMPFSGFIQPPAQPEIMTGTCGGEEGLLRSQRVRY